jgi:tRNA-Thr(GGU) m(6)t(6)A37 methyltransferase TsaA
MSGAKKVQISVKPIGWVRNEIKEPKRRQWDKVVSELVLNPELTEATEGMEEFSHVVVLFWMHQVPAEARLQTKAHPQRRADLPLVGVLVTRSPARPNPIGMAVVRLLERKGNVLKVKGLDAIDGTPLLDIKPCFPSDAMTQVQAPEWVTKLQRSRIP